MARSKTVCCRFWAPPVADRGSPQFLSRGAEAVASAHPTRAGGGGGGWGTRRGHHHAGGARCCGWVEGLGNAQRTIMGACAAVGLYSWEPQARWAGRRGELRGPAPPRPTGRAARGTLQPAGPGPARRPAAARGERSHEAPSNRGEHQTRARPRAPDGRPADHAGARGRGWRGPGGGDRGRGGQSCTLGGPGIWRAKVHARRLGAGGSRDAAARPRPARRAPGAGADTRVSAAEAAPARARARVRVGRRGAVGSPTKPLAGWRGKMRASGGPAAGARGFNGGRRFVVAPLFVGRGLPGLLEAYTGRRRGRRPWRGQRAASRCTHANGGGAIKRQ
jgi:hypothetical protein